MRGYKLSISDQRQCDMENTLSLSKFAAMAIAALFLLSAAVGFRSRELCNTEICTQLASSGGVKIQIADWPFSAIDNTAFVNSANVMQIKQMLMLENFEADSELGTNKIGLIRFRKTVRIHRLLYVHVGSDQLIIEASQALNQFNVIRVLLIRESFGNL